MRGKLILIMGPTGSGKGTLMRHAISRFPELTTLQSYTTRARRGDAIENTHYTFVSADEFEQRLNGGEFLEWAEFSGNRYGTLKADIETGLQEGKVMLKEMEVQGIRQARKLLAPQELIVIFIDAGPWDELRRRALAREHMEEAVLEQRRVRYEDEQTFMPEADIVVRNYAGKTEDATAALEGIVAKALADAHHG